MKSIKEGSDKFVRKGWYERDEVAKIDHNWVRLNCKNLTKREKELLKIVHDRKLIRRDHLEILHTAYRNSGVRRTNVINRSIKKLFEKICLDKVHQEAEFMTGNLPAVLSLDRAGAILLGVKFHKRIKHSYRIINNKKHVFRKLPNNYPHIHGVNDLEVRTLLLGENLGFSIYKWELEEKNKKTVQFNERFTIIPDVFVILNVKNKPFAFFLEYDTGMEDHRHRDEFPMLRDKLEKYRKYKLSGAWKTEKWAMKLGFPLLLFVTEDDQKRVKYVNEKASKLGLRTIAVENKDYEKKLSTILPL